MYCKMLNGTLSVETCIKRQKLAYILSESTKGCGTFEQCFACNTGIELRDNYHVCMDSDVTNLIRNYVQLTKPKRIEIKTKPPNKIRVISHEKR